MATCALKYAIEYAGEHILTCEKHDLIIDMICEDCDEFICTRCAKTDHKEHDWKTMPTAGSQRRGELKETISMVEEKDLEELDKNIKMAIRKMEDNQKCCDLEGSKIQKHFDAIVSKLNEIKKNLDTTLREHIERKNAEVNEKKINLERKNEQIKDLVKFLEEKHRTMSDYSLIDNLRDLKSLVSNKGSDLERGNYAVRYRRGNINEGSLESMMGHTFDLDNITVTETESFQYGDNIIVVLEANCEYIYFVGDFNSDYFDKVDKKNNKIEKVKIASNDVCVTDSDNMYATDYKNLYIVRLSLSGSVKRAFCTAPLTPIGICQSNKGGLLVTLRDKNLKSYHPDSWSRRLVRHMTMTGDVIREYEYREDGQTRLFTVPGRIKQNGNNDICVVNGTSINTGELVILSSSGFIKTVYHGKNQEFKFIPSDVVCDSHCNIIVSDGLNGQVHLLSPDGEFMKYLLTENEVTRPSSMSLYKSTLLVGTMHGLVKVFQYHNKT